MPKPGVKFNIQSNNKCGEIIECKQRAMIKLAIRLPNGLSLRQGRTHHTPMGGGQNNNAAEQTKKE